MKITVNKKVKSTKGLMVVPVFKENLKKPAKIYPQTIKKFLEKRVKAKEFNAKKLELLPTYIEDKKLPEKIALLGCGKKDKFKGRKARELGGKLGKYAKSSDSEILTILILPEMAEYVEELLEGILMGK